MKDHETKAYYDTFSAGYEDHRHDGYHRWLDTRSVGLVKDLASGARVLEVGCGTGLILRDVTPLAGSATGLDLSHGMLRAARSRSLRVVQGSATALPFPDGHFDLVYSFKVLAHVPAIGDAVAEMARVTRPGGRMMLEFYNRRSLRYLVRRLRPPGKIGPGTTEEDVFTRFDNARELEALLPPDVRLERVEGLRVATLAPQLFAVPGLGRAWARLEDALSQSPLRHFAGFLVLVLHKGA